MAEEVQGQPTEEPNVDELAQSVAAGILRSEGDIPRDEKGKFAHNTPKAPEQAAEPQEEQPQEEEETKEPEAPQEEGPDWEALKSLKRRLKVKAEDGSDEEVELTLEEMEKGVMLERSYRQKTAQLAREREAVQSKIKEAIEPRLKEYDEKLQIAEQVIWHTLAPEIQNIDWNKLATENPAEWAQKYQHVQNVNTKLAQVQAERQKIAQAREAEFKEAQKKAVGEAIEILQREIPGWNNDLYGKILKTGSEYGFKVDELNAITDPRAIKVLNDARQWREFKAKPIADKRVAQVPKVAKPGTAQKPDTGDKWKEGMAKLQKTGHTRDAVALAKMLLENE